MTTGKNITNDRIYDAINSTRLELKGDINRLETKFDNLEAGRLTRAEGNINSLGLDLQKAINQINTRIDGNKTSQAVLSTKVMVLWGGIYLVISAGITILIARIIK